ncbi:zinc finger matrin-type protein 5 [Amyelois transitella]|uniref:zinc finger matrin-type protein 5 n=1 Tax=Amyelois transitella TaxID=680683 RepID=UPI00298FD2DC|nr:zinc finger matrin-type protein 5 [Amyelois transitella]XP_060808061.1 zinc finger matrin-type protein 5 [Amyelois transitella]
MGKRYYCNYCDKNMVATPAIVKTHNKGIVHQKLVQEHYQKFKDPETILAEEQKKKPCLRFARGECQFGGICRYSHYTQEQINQLREYVLTKNRSNLDNHSPSFQDLYNKLLDGRNAPNVKNENTVLYDSNGLTHVLPWTYNDSFDAMEGLPPSIKKFKLEDFANTKITEWG